MVELSRSMDRPDGSRGFAVSRYDYDKNGNVVKIQTPTGGQVLREYDAVDRLIAETHIDKASGIYNRMEFAYDKAGNLVEITDNQGRRTQVEYDLLNREIRRVEKDGGVTRSFYDSNGNQNRTTYRLDAWSTNIASVGLRMLDFAIRAGVGILLLVVGSVIVGGVKKGCAEQRAEYL